VSDPDKRAQVRYPAALRVKLKYPDVETFIQKYASNISEGGIFVASKNLPEVGTHLRFEFLLAASDSMTSIIRGEGEVRWLRTDENASASQPMGMGIEFTELDGDSRAIVRRALAYRAQTSGEGATKELEAEPATRLTRTTDVPPDLQTLASKPREATAAAPVAPEFNGATPTPPISRSMAERDLTVIARESGLSEADINEILTRYDSRPIDFSSVAKLAATVDDEPEVSKSEALVRLRELLK
jgi:uncharacterized protein (TIGR02266 family)